MAAPASGFRILPSPFVPLTDATGRSSSRIQPYKPMVHPCRLCPARCCHTTVKASLPDVLRLCSTLEVPFFVGFALESSASAGRGFRVDRDDRFVDPADGWPGLAEIRLRRRASGGCVGLLDLGGHARCGVYGARPTACRLYPITWEDDTTRAGPDAVLCPAPYAVTPAEAERAERDAQDSKRFWAAHEAAVADWNAVNPPARPLEEALRFLLGHVAAALAWPLPEVVLASGTPEQRLGDALRASGVLPRPPGGGAGRGGSESAPDGPRPFAGLDSPGR